MTDGAGLCSFRMTQDKIFGLLGIILSDFLALLYPLSRDQKGIVVTSNDIPNCIFTSLQCYKIGHSDSSDRDRVSSDSLRPLPSESVCPRRFLPPRRPVRRSGGPAAPAAWSSILGRAPRRAMNFPARCAGCPEPPATPASRPAARREASRRHGPPPVVADAKLGRAGKLPRE